MQCSMPAKKKLDEGALKNILCHLLFSHLAPSFERRIAGRVLLRRCYSRLQNRFRRSSPKFLSEHRPYSQF